jgi:nucleotide-binding universal stress UspA family protein
MTTISAPTVVGVDGSPQSLTAVDWAAREAVARQSPLRIVHAFPWPPLDVPGAPMMGPPDPGLRDAAEQVLSAAADRARRAAATALDISTYLSPNVPAAALVEGSQAAALVVVGHRGLGRFTGLLLGSVAGQTAEHAACPVVIVRGNETREGAPDSGHVVVGVDGSDRSRLAVDFAFAHAALHRFGILAVHVYELPAFAPSADPRIPSYIDVIRDEATRLLADALAGYGDRYPAVPVRLKVLHGAIADVLVAESADAILTVVGSRGRGGFTGLLLGSTSQRLLHHASGPLAITRTRPTGHDSASSPAR